MSDIRFLLSGDSAVTVEFGNEISEHINAQIRAFSIALTESKLPGIVELVPTYRSLMVHYDPEVIPYGVLVKKLKGLLNQLTTSGFRQAMCWKSPCSTAGRKWAPTLALSPSTITKRLTRSSGFTPPRNISSICWALPPVSPILAV